jgi:hypothetical protein
MQAPELDLRLTIPAARFSYDDADSVDDDAEDVRCLVKTGQIQGNMQAFQMGFHATVCTILFGASHVVAAHSSSSV